MTPTHQKLFISIFCALTFFKIAQAETLYEDYFSYAKGENIVEQSLTSSSASLGGASYEVSAGTGDFYKCESVDGHMARIGADLGLALPFGASSNFTVPETVTVALEFRVWSLWNGVDKTTAEDLENFSLGGIRLGFWSSIPKGDFIGIAVDGFGNIKVTNGQKHPITTAKTVLDAGVFYRLTYTISTASGAVSKIELQDVEAGKTIYSGKFLEINSFKSDSLAFVGFAALGNDSWQNGFIRYFSVTSP